MDSTATASTPTESLRANRTGTGSTGVRFGTVAVREHYMTMGGKSPATRIGAPVALDWEYHQCPEITLEEFEDRASDRRKQQKRSSENRSPSEFYLNYYQRQKILARAGFAREEHDAAEKKARRERMLRKLSEYESFPFLFAKSFRVGRGRRKSKRFVEKYRKEHGLSGQKRPRRLSSKDKTTMS